MRGGARRLPWGFRAAAIGGPGIRISYAARLSELLGRNLQFCLVSHLMLLAMTHKREKSSRE